MRSTGATWHRSVRAGRGRGAEAPETRRRDAAETSQNLAAGPPDPLAASSCEGRPGPQLGGPLAAAAVVSAGAGPRQRTRRAGGGREARRAPSRRRRRARLPGADAGGAQRPGRPESSSGTRLGADALCVWQRPAPPPSLSPAGQGKNTNKHESCAQILRMTRKLRPHCTREDKHHHG
ncbi:unnamed protein product [Prorocentrum cordatum]|uniref:Uncharacterized protein n=1 Tax=Prorocentrum cordatum TaxID=2364126 RepID=A0ABN9U0A3_9DINO|nr:unnamed protein product [Polarella glacialis]